MHTFSVFIQKNCVSAAAGLVVSVFTQTAPAQSASPEGVWRYKDRGVWVQINREGRAFQCRIDRDETTTYTSLGRVTGNKIEWEAVWGENEYEIIGQSLVLVASGRRLEFTRSARSIDAICKSPLPT